MSIDGVDAVDRGPVGAQGPGPGMMGPPMGPTSVAWFTSTDGITWERQDNDLTDKFVSLGLSIRTDGALWLSGIDQSGLATEDEREHGPRPEGFVGQNGAWERIRWDDIHDPDALEYIDPQWFGEAIWYISRQGGGDPVQLDLV